MKWKPDHLPLLLIASTIAMIGLVIFQYKWINHSRELYNEVFHQRVCMALCSTLEEYGEGAICSNAACTPVSLIPGMKDIQTPADNALIHNEDFQSDLRKTLDFYNIDLNYQISQIGAESVPTGSASQGTCVVSLPSNATEQENTFIKLDFPERQTFMLSKMKFMIGASIMILFFTAMVLLLANWWLMKQKRLLLTNVEMYNNMAHEFRTPLTNIKLASGLLRNDNNNTSNTKLVDIITRENGKLIQQVERILHLARLDNGDYALQHTQINLRNFLQHIIDELSIQIEEKYAHVELAIDDRIEIFGDSQHLTNAFRNLLDNALKYATAKPVITISATEKDTGILISVADNGIGIAYSQQEMIFEKFQRIQTGNLHEQKGFGLGLAYVKKIVDLHKGTINVVSDLHKGSRFDVYLPKCS